MFSGVSPSASGVGEGGESVAERTITTNLVVVGAEEYVSAIERVTQALRAANEAKKEFDDLFGKASNCAEDYISSN